MPMAFILICARCNSSKPFKEKNAECSGCGHHVFKVARRSGIPSTFSRDPEKPYRRKEMPGDGLGNKLTMPGNEDLGPEGEPGGGSFGLNTRGPGDPRGRGETSMYDREYADQLKEDLPTEETLIDVRKPGNPDDLGPKPGTFHSPNDAIGSEHMMEREEPVGPFNMHNKVGPHNQPDDFPRLTDDIFEQVREKRRRKR